MSAAREGWTERILSVSSPFRCTKTGNTICCFLFLFMHKKGLDKFNAAVRWTAAGTSSKTGGNHNIPSPFHRTTNCDLNVYFL